MATKLSSPIARPLLLIIFILNLLATTIADDEAIPPPTFQMTTPALPLTPPAQPGANPPPAQTGVNTPPSSYLTPMDGSCLTCYTQGPPAGQQTVPSTAEGNLTNSPPAAVNQTVPSPHGQVYGTLPYWPYYTGGLPSSAASLSTTVGIVVAGATGLVLSCL